jgi:hypothetical protein
MLSLELISTSILSMFNAWILIHHDIPDIRSDDIKTRKNRRGRVALAIYPSHYEGVPFPTEVSHWRSSIRALQFSTCSHELASATSDRRDRASGCHWQRDSALHRRTLIRVALKFSCKVKDWMDPTNTHGPACSVHS